LSYPDRQYLFENLFAIGSVNLLAGMSGIGKTRFSFQIVEEIEQSQTFLGFPALIPIKASYWALDRTLASIHKTLNTMNCELQAPLHSLFDNVPHFDELRLPTQLVDSNLVIIDGLDCLVPKLIDSREVGRLLFLCAKLAKAASVAILGVLGTAKVKDSDSYIHPRERIIGSSFWGRMSEDIILISPSQTDDPNLRLVTILPRNAAEVNIRMVFENGRLIRDVLFKPDDSDMQLYDLLPGAFSTSDAQAIAAGALSMSRATFFRSMRRLCDQRLIANLEKGLYRKTSIN
jgi:hypothetical protein